MRLLVIGTLLAALTSRADGQNFASSGMPRGPIALEPPYAAMVVGTVTNRDTKQPVAGAQVGVVGGTAGSLTDAEGKYRLAGVRAGPIILRVKMIGFTQQDRSVTLPDGQTTTVDFELAPASLLLSTVVVTGTPGGTQVKEIGNAVEHMDAAEVMKSSPAMDVQQMLGQRNPGVMVLMNPGMVGTGSAVRIRGAASLSLTNQPIMYVDGVRVDNNASAGPNIRQGRQAARLNDFNPEDIESIEIIKGPAAATLYGTEASNGVIQILTKRGKSGKPVWTVAARAGGSYMSDPEGRFRKHYGVNPNTKMVDSFNIFRLYKEQSGKDLFTTGPMQSLNGSLSGGTDAARYFMSADYSHSVGIVDYNWTNGLSTHANLSLLPTSKLQFNAQLNFMQSETRFAQAASGFGVWDMLVYATPALLTSTTKGFRYATPEVAGTIDSRSKVNRFTGGLDIKHNTTSWLTQQLKAGMDVGNTVNFILFPRVPDGEINYFQAVGVGQKTLENVSTTYQTIDYAATAKYNFNHVTTATSFGVQYYQKQSTLASEIGTNFPTTSVTTISGAAVTTAGEDFAENKTLGSYLQEQIGWRDKVFVTAAVRADANSAFGKDYHAAIYPKLSGAWVLSDELFWPYERINTVRLRGAWGQAGQQPDAFSAITLYNPATGPGNNPIVVPGSLGNPKLRPERGEELELGVDLGFLRDRVTSTFTFFNRVTKDAIVQQRIQPSTGFPGSRVVNLGEVKSWGTEFGINARVVESAWADWDLGFSYATSKNRIESLGGIQNIQLNTDQEHRPGFPVGAIFWYKVLSAEWSSASKLVNVMCDSGDANHTPIACASAPRLYYGQPTPAWTGSISNAVTLKKALRLSALIDYQGGMMYEDGEIQAGHQNFINSEESNKPIPLKDPIFAAYQSVVPRAPLGLYNAGFAKLRELSASYTLPAGYAKLVRSSGASLTAAWRNVAILWVAQKEIYGTRIFDPEMRTPGAELDIRFQTMIPPTSQFVFTARLTY